MRHPPDVALQHICYTCISMSDADLLRRIASGDEDALITIHRSYANLVFSVAMRVLGNQADAEEISQDVFMTLWKKGSTYESDKGSLSTWLGVIARRKAIDLVRKRAGREDHTSLDEYAEILHVSPNGIAPHTSDVAADIDLSVAMKDLPGEQRECVDLLYFGGLTQQELSDHLKIPLGTVKSRVRLAMDKLREAMVVRQGDGEGNRPPAIVRALNSWLFGTLFSLA